MAIIDLSDSASNRTSQQTRFNKKKTGEEESFVLDFAYNPESVDRLYLLLDKTGSNVDAPTQSHFRREAIKSIFDYNLGEFVTTRSATTWEAYARGENSVPSEIEGIDWTPPFNKKCLLEVPIMSSRSFIFGYADIVVEGSLCTKRHIHSASDNENRYQESQTYTRFKLLIEVKSTRCSVLDLIKQLKSYSQFHEGLPVFIHLYDLEEREVRALKANGIHPVDGRLLV